MIRVEKLAVTTGSFTLREISFEISNGEYVILKGKTGSGKTTLLECLCGLRPIKSGRIWLEGRDVTRMPPAERGVGYVPQDRALFPTMNVRDHLQMALRLRRYSKSQVKTRVAELVGLLGIEHLLDRRPAGLSGGESQRVALGRALSFRPVVLLLDEPLTGLDDETRGQIYDLIKQVRKETRVTTIHVTHQQADLQLADTVLEITDGSVQPIRGA